MKKSLIIILLLFINYLSNAQETSFKFSKEGFTDFVVINIDGKTAPFLYKKTIDWVSLTYVNFKEVLKAQIENDYIRIEGINEGCLYQIEISFKDGKYKFDLISYLHIAGRTNLLDMNIWFDNNGNIKNQRLEKIIAKHELFLNGLNNSLANHIKNETSPSKKNDW
jgi:hypothetical protein